MATVAIHLNDTAIRRPFQRNKTTSGIADSSKKFILRTKN